MDENASDIRAFIEDRISNNSRLKSKMDAELLDKATSALQERAQGMFRLVDLQIKSLSSLKTSRDIEDRLHALPATLAESYEEIYEEIKASGEHAFALAIATFQWLLQAAESSLAMQNFALFTTYWPGLEGQRHKVEEVQDVCSVFVSTDESGFRFSHLTVREYFESRAASGDQMYDTLHAHSAIASACLALAVQLYPLAVQAADANLATATKGENALTVIAAKGLLY